MRHSGEGRNPAPLGLRRADDEYENHQGIKGTKGSAHSAALVYLVSLVVNPVLSFIPGPGPGIHVDG